MILALLDEAVGSGARFEIACDTIGPTARTVQRWKEALQFKSFHPLAELAQLFALGGRERARRPWLHVASARFTQVTLGASNCASDHAAKQLEQR
jgi:hypothetical protein